MALPASAQQPLPAFQQLAHDRWTMDDGLPFPGGYELAIDKDGFLWLGSIAGLVRFDGQRFVVHDRSNTPAMQGNLIRGIASDGTGRLWVGTERGVIYRQSGRFLPLPALADRNVYALGPDDRGAMLLSNDDAVFRVGPQLELEKILALGSVHLHLSHGGSNWYASTDGLYREHDGQLQAQSLPGLGHGHVGLLLSQGDALLAGSTNGLYRLQQGQWQRHPDPDLHKRILAMTADGQGNVWISTELKLMRLRGRQLVERVDVSELAPATRAMLFDPAGNLWMASHANGLHRFWSGLGGYLPIPYDPAQAQFLWAVAAWKAELYTAGTYGLARVEGGRQRTLPESAGLPIIYSLYPEAQQLLLGTVRGVYRYDGHRVQPVAALAALADTRSNTFLRDADGSLWIGTSRGLYRLDRQQQLQRLSGSDNSTRWEIRALLRSRAGTLYASGDAGVWQVTNDGLQLLPLPDPNPGIYALLELDDGRLLAGARGSGQLYLHDGQHWLSLDQARGIPHNEVYALVADPEGGVLVSGLRGAYRLDARQLALASAQPNAMLRIQPGLTLHKRQSPGQQVVCCVGGGDGRGLLHQGRYYLPASQGLYTLDTPMHEGSGSSQPRIEQVQTGLDSYLPSTRPLQLGADERDLRISFSVLNLSPLHWPRVLYRLEGYEDHWQELGADEPPLARYTNLPAGNYRFHVTDAASGARTASQSFQIAPAFHETAWFKTLAVLGCLALLGISLLLNTRWNRLRTRQLEELINHRTQDLALANARLDTLARTDPLTGLNNRRHAATVIPQRMSHDTDSQTLLPQHLFVLMDVDHFKAINDRHGHEIGDAVLVGIASRLRQQLRQGDCLARWGGEEFLMVCFDLPVDDHVAVADRVLAAVNQQPLMIPGVGSLPVSVSLGLALLPGLPAGQAERWKDGICQADAALYASKQAGRSRWTLYTPEQPAVRTG
ncbi:MAG: diguanylate cyclase [Stenotrophomonas sp.]